MVEGGMGWNGMSGAIAVCVWRGVAGVGEVVAVAVLLRLM